ncbi:MAG: HAD family hydrolase [Acaryochloridaceae cyanobacterium CSU_3_4]|nr:HAD family hydrolase [Acaryochloridaceae cyanobacterium CSU_3_4]
MVSFDWIFFDCFNTLIDDFDQTGEELALLPVYSLPVAAGLYASAAEFRQEYHRWRDRQWRMDHREILMKDRYQSVLQARSPQSPAPEIEQLAAAMVDCFQGCYQQSLRLPEGVEEMLEYWQDKAHIGVVSNFYIPHWPTELLASFGFNPYLEFVLDSAACGWRKPGQSIYGIACELAQVSQTERSRILFVGDHLQNDVLAPQQFGMQGLYFDRSQERSSSPSPTGVAAIMHWSQFRLTLFDQT